MKKFLPLRIIVITLFLVSLIFGQTKIYLARHGQTNWNKEGRIQGWTDTDLNSVGKKQAKALFKYLKEEDIKIVYTSTLKRTIQTAQLFVKKTSIPVRKIEELKEINTGLLQGHLNSEPKIKKELELMKKNVNHKAPQGESYRDLYNRVASFIEKILKRHKNETILIIGHSGTNSMILAYLLNISLEEAVQIHQANNLVFTIFILPGQKFPTVNWKILK